MNEIILAPYIGDEVIGCYDYLNRGLIKHVFYFYDLRRKRRREAAACGKFFGFVVDFVGARNSSSGFEVKLKHQ